MKEIFFIGLALLFVDLLISIKSYYCIKNYWKTKKIRELVYEEMTKKRKVDPVESRTFRKRFKKGFNHYRINMVADGKIGADEVENCLLDLVANDVYELLKVTPPI